MSARDDPVSDSKLVENSNIPGKKSIVAKQNSQQEYEPILRRVMDYSIMSLEQTLLDIAEQGKEWQRVETNVPGLYLVKAPATKKKPAYVMVELNPVNEEGKPLKRKGLFLRNTAQLLAFKELIENPKVQTILENIDSVFNADSVANDSENTVGKVTI